MSSSVPTNKPSATPDRRDVGPRLARCLTAYKDARPVVVGVAPDAMPLAAEIARALGAPLDTVTIEPLALGPAPAERIGVAAEGGVTIYDPDRRDRVESDLEAVDAALLDTEARLQRRTELWHQGGRRQSLNGRTVLLVTEALVDERSAAAAACAVRDRGAANIVYVAPEARLTVVRAVEADWVDAVVGLELIDDGVAPAGCFGETPIVSDEAIKGLLRENQRERRRVRRQAARS